MDIVLGELFVKHLLRVLDTVILGGSVNGNGLLGAAGAERESRQQHYCSKCECKLLSHFHDNWPFFFSFSTDGEEMRRVLISAPTASL